MSKINIDKNWYNETTKEFDCPYCKKGYSKKGISTHILRTHLYVEHYKNINYNNMQEKHIRENCEHCNKSFSIKYLEKHKIECLKKINNIYICEKCGINTNIKYGSGRFCSVKCANKREHSKKHNNNISKGLKNSNKRNLEIEQNIIVNDIDINNIPIILKDKKEKYNLDLLNRDFNTLKFELIKKRILLEQNNKCNKCNIDEWLNKPIILELEHKDGNHHNNKRENLECLCPNCHSQTDTWRGRNQKRKQNRISDEELLLNFYKFKNIRQTLIYLNMTPKGKNYERFKSVLTKHNINYI